MKNRILNEKNIVVALFVTVMVIFSLAQEDTKKIEKMYQDYPAATSSVEDTPAPGSIKNTIDDKSILPAAVIR
jgi:hypothetical protein